MDALQNSSANLIMGLVAGCTIFLGMPIARWKGASESLRGFLALASAGVLIFLIMEVGYHMVEELEHAAKGYEWAELGLYSAVMLTGLGAGLVGLAKIEEVRGDRRQEGAAPLELATMIAIGIGMHNFAEGLAIGQSFASGAVALGAVLVVGFALHNATEGFGIAAPLVGQNVSWGRLFLLGLVGGAPTALGAAIGGVWVNDVVKLLFLSLAVGSLIYVTRELFRLRFSSMKATGAMLAIMIGLVVGIATELVVEVAMAQGAKGTASGGMEVHMGSADSPKEITIPAGSTLTLENETDAAMEFEGEGLFVGELHIKPHAEASVKVTNKEGEYSIHDEHAPANALKVTVKAADGADQDHDDHD